MLTRSTPAFGTDSYVNGLCDAKNRLTHLAMVSMLDEAHRVVLDALEQASRYQDTVFVFISDNGGNQPMFSRVGRLRECSYGFNYPLRGSKFSWWEVRVFTLYSLPLDFLWRDVRCILFFLLVIGCVVSFSDLLCSCLPAN